MQLWAEFSVVAVTFANNTGQTIALSVRSDRKDHSVPYSTYLPDLVARTEPTDWNIDGELKNTPLAWDPNAYSICVLDPTRIDSRAHRVDESLDCRLKVQQH